MSLVCREKSQQNVSSNILNMHLRGCEKKNYAESSGEKRRKVCRLRGKQTGLCRNYNSNEVFFMVFGDRYFFIQFSIAL